MTLTVSGEPVIARLSARRLYISLTRAVNRSRKKGRKNLRKSRDDVASYPLRNSIYPKGKHSPNGVFRSRNLLYCLKNKISNFLLWNCNKHYNLEHITKFRGNPWKMALSPRYRFFKLCKKLYVLMGVLALIFLVVSA